jgi:ABC-type phosphate transport system substrate-binding protein
MLRLPASSRSRLQIRVAIYIVVIAVLFLVRGNLGRVGSLLAPGDSTASDSTLSVAGLDVAPSLIPELADHYRTQYPRIVARLLPGGTNQALESLLQGRADAGFLVRPPTAREQGLFREIRGDTVLWYPAAVGGLLLLRSADAPGETVSVEGLRARLDGTGDGAPDRIYAPDPNSGIWDAFLGAIRVPPDSIRADVVFLRDWRGVMEAVRVDRGSLGVVGTLSLVDSLAGGTSAGEPLDVLRERGVAALPLRSRTGEGIARPTVEGIGSGDYPLFHYLYVAVPRDGTREGGKFVTYVTSARGQRLVERTGFLPARLVPREIYLNRGSS